jgi:hypothetical protein
MVVYRFKFDMVTAESGMTSELLKFLETLVVEDKDVINYLPSKKDVVLGLESQAYDKIINWVKANVNYKFEFEEHSEFDRALVQFFPGENPSVSVQYLLPLFPPESYLEL